MQAAVAIAPSRRSTYLQQQQRNTAAGGATRQLWFESAAATAAAPVRHTTLPAVLATHKPGRGKNSYGEVQFHAAANGGQCSVADVAVAAWQCSKVISEGLLPGLQEVGMLLSCLPIHEACNNPGCRNHAGFTEQGLVSGKACLCGGVRAAHYCSRACQKQHGERHKQQCSGSRSGHAMALQ